MDCIEYIDSIQVSDGTFYATNSKWTVVYTNPNAGYSVDGRVLVNSNEFQELAACDYMQIIFQLPVLIDHLSIGGGTSVDSAVIYAKNANGDFACVCEPTPITGTVQIQTEDHTPSNTYILLFPKPIAKKPIKLTIQLNVHHSTVNQVLLSKYVTTNTMKALEKCLDAAVHGPLSKWADRQEQTSRVTSVMQETLQAYLDKHTDGPKVNETRSMSPQLPSQCTTENMSSSISTTQTTAMLSEKVAHSLETCSGSSAARSESKDPAFVVTSRHCIYFFIVMLVLSILCACWRVAHVKSSSQ